MDRFRLLRALILQDLRLFFADKRAVITTVLVPVGIASFFAMIFGGLGRSDEKRPPVALVVADKDGSATSRKIIEKLTGDSSLAVTLTDEPGARLAVRQGKAAIGLVLPERFGAQAGGALFAGASASRPKAILLRDPSKDAEFQLVRGLLTQHVVATVSQEAFSQSSGSLDASLMAIEGSPGMKEAEKSALGDALRALKRYYALPERSPQSESVGGMQMPAEFADEAVVAPNQRAAQGKANAIHAFVGMAVQGLLFFAMDFALGLVRERRGGLLKRLRAAPLAPGVVLLSRLLAAALIALVILGFVLGVGALAFGLRVGGSWPGFVLVAIASSLMVAGFGLLIAALGKTESQCRAAAVPAVIGMSVLGGAWFPTFLFPAWVHGISKLLPSRWAIDGFDAMTWRGLPLSHALTPTLILLGFASAFTLVALPRFRFED